MKRDGISTASVEMALSKFLVLAFIRDEAVEKYANYFTLSTFSIPCNIQKIGPGFVIVNFYRFKNINEEDFFIIKFQISIGCKYQTIVINSTDVFDNFNIRITKDDCKEKSLLIRIFQKILATMTSERTLLYNKIALVIKAKGSQMRDTLFENSINFYDVGKSSIEADHKFLKQRTIFFIPYEKKTIKIGGNFLIITLARDVNASNLFIFLYAPMSKRRFVVKYPLIILAQRFLETYKPGTSAEFSDISKNFGLSRLYPADKKYLEPDIDTSACNVPLSNHILNLFRLCNSNLIESKGFKTNLDLMRFIMSEYRNNGSYFHWLSNVELFKRNQSMILKFRNFEGIIREYISMRVVDQDDILIETCLDSYLDHNDFFKPYYSIDLQRMQKANFFVTITCSSKEIRRVHSINIWNFCYINQIESSNESLKIFGKTLKDQVYKLESEIIQSLNLHKGKFKNKEKKRIEAVKLSAYKNGSVQNMRPNLRPVTVKNTSIEIAVPRYINRTKEHSFRLTLPKTDLDNSMKLHDHLVGKLGNEDQERMGPSRVFLGDPAEKERTNFHHGSKSFVDDRSNNFLVLPSKFNLEKKMRSSQLLNSKEETEDNPEKKQTIITKNVSLLTGSPKEVIFVPRICSLDSDGFVFKTKPIFSTVFTLRPKRTLTIFIEHFSKLISQKGGILNLQS